MRAKGGREVGDGAAGAGPQVAHDCLPGAAAALKKNMIKRIKDNEENTLQIRQSAFEEMLALSHKELALAEIREKAMNPDKIDEISAKYKNLKNDLDNLVSPLKNAQKETDKWIESMGSKKTDLV